MMIEKVMIQSGAKSLRNSGGVRAPPHDVGKSDEMIQSGAKSLKLARGWWGGGGSPPMMIEQVMIELGQKNI